jgi:hypothetical protein
MESGLMRTFCSFLIIQTQPETVGSTLICTSKKPKKSSSIETDGLRLENNLGYIQTEMYPDVQKAG